MNLRAILLPAALSAALIAPVAAFARQAAQAPAPGTFAPSAQGQRHGHHRGFMGMLKGVNLSDQQKTQIKQIVQQFRQAHPAGSRMDPQARLQMRQQLMNVLTPQQRAQVQQNMQQMRERRQQHRKDERAEPSAQPSQAPLS